MLQIVWKNDRCMSIRIDPDAYAFMKWYTS